MIDIKIADIAQLSRIAAVESASFSVPWSRSGIKELLENSSALVLTATDETFDKMSGNNFCVGYIGSYIIADECEITRIAVLPEYRKKGVASALLSRLISEVSTHTVQKHAVRQINLEVRRSNTAAISLYSKFGFKIVGERQGYYTYPCEDALILCKLI